MRLKSVLPFAAVCILMTNCLGINAINEADAAMVKSEETNRVINLENEFENEIAEDELETVSREVLSPDREHAETAAQTLLYSAFAYDGCGTSPTITEGDGNVSFRYLNDKDDPSDFFIVDFYENYDYPVTLYHFCHSNEEEHIHIEEDENFKFSEEMETRARKFVESVYGVDCSSADAHAYGYANKVSVQLDVAENLIFQVRFYYRDTEPVGVLYFKSEEYARQAMDANHAKRLYS